MPTFNRDDYPIRPTVSVPKASDGYVRNATAAVWASANPVLEAGEPGFELDTKVYKIGDGSTPWNALTSVAGGAGGGDEALAGLRFMTSAEQYDYIAETQVTFSGSGTDPNPVSNVIDFTENLSVIDATVNGDGPGTVRFVYEGAGPGLFEITIELNVGYQQIADGTTFTAQAMFANKHFNKYTFTPTEYNKTTKHTGMLKPGDEVPINFFGSYDQPGTWPQDGTIYVFVSCRGLIVSD